MVPVTIAIAAVLSLYVDSPVALPQTYRSFAIAIAIAIALQVTLTLALSSVVWGALAAGTGVILLSGHELFGLVLVGSALAWELYRRRAVRLGHERPPPLTAAAPAAALISVLLLMVVAINGFLVGALGFPHMPPPPAAGVGTPGSAPDIFVVLLDGYARQDALEELDFDNSHFLDELAGLGFQVVTESRSNYSRTGLTLASLFNMAYVDEIPELASPPEGYNRQHRYLSEALRTGNRALDVLSSAGYETFYVPSRIAQYAVEPVDHMLRGNEPDNFELHALGRTAIGAIVEAVAPGTLYAQQRDRILETFADIERLATSEDERPRFVFAHLMTPHPPFLFGARGSPRVTPECFPERCSIFDPPDDPQLSRTYYGDQVSYTNGLVVQAVSAIIDANPKAVIVVMSDHGHRLDFSDGLESTSNLMAVRADRVDAPTTMTPVGLFPRLFNAYLGTDLAIPADRSFFSTSRSPWPMHQMP